MASAAAAISAKPVKSIKADRFERILAVAAIVLLVFAAVAIAKGQSAWGRVPLFVWLHLATIIVALALTPVMLLRPRGDHFHRQIGTVWVGAMLMTALVSLFIRSGSNGGFSVIHILSVWTLIQAPLIWWRARMHRVAAHRSAVRAMVTGALLIAGFFTFPFGRMLGGWLFS